MSEQLKTITDVMIDIRGFGNNLDNAGVAANADAPLDSNGGIYQRTKDILAKVKELKAASDSNDGNITTMRDDITNKYNELAVTQINGHTGKYGDMIAKWEDIAGSNGTSGKYADFITKYNAVQPHFEEIDRLGTVATSAALDRLNTGSTANNIDTVGTHAANVDTVAGSIGSVNTVAADITKVIKVAEDLNEAVSEVETVANDLNEATSEIEVVAGSIANVNAVGGSIGNVNTVSGSIANVNTVAGDVAHIDAVAANEANVNTVAADVVKAGNDPLAADYSHINHAAANAQTATTKAGEASASASAALTSKNDAATILGQVETIYDNFDDRYLGSFDTANEPTVDNDGNALITGALYWNTTENEHRFYNGSTWERPEHTATTAATNASNSASAASTSETNAANSATAASNSASAASTSETNAAASADWVDDLFLGSKADDPATDNDGDALQQGAIYYNTTSDPKQLKIYTGTEWAEAAFNVAGNVISFNTRNGDVVLTQGDVETAVGYTLDTAVALGTDDAKVASQKAIKTYADALLVDTPLTGVPTAPTANAGTSNTQVATTKYTDDAVAIAVAGEMTYKGAYDADTNAPNLDDGTKVAVSVGDMYTVTVAGTFYDVAVAVGDALIAENTANASSADWTIVNRNLAETAVEVTLVPQGEMTSTNVQAGMEELQTDINTRAIKAQTSGTSTRYTDTNADGNHAYEYKMYMENGDMIWERTA